MQGGGGRRGGPACGEDERDGGASVQDHQGDVPSVQDGLFHAASKAVNEVSQVEKYYLIGNSHLE